MATGAPSMLAPAEVPIAMHTAESDIRTNIAPAHPRAERDAACELGYNERLWQEGIAPEACLRHWRWLSPAETRAAKALGYTEAIWESELALEDAAL